MTDETWYLDTTGGCLRPTTAISEESWYVDSLNGSDTRTGNSASNALATIGEIFRRLGSNTPKLTQKTTITLLNPIPATDAWSGYRPIFGPNGSLTITAPLAIQSTVECGTVAAPNFGAGTLGTVNVPEQSWSAGQYVLDVTSQSYFWIVEDLGSGTAAISAVRKTPDGWNNGPGAYGSITEGDVLQLCTLQTLNIMDAQSYGSEGLLRGLLFLRLNLVPANEESYVEDQVSFAECSFNYDVLFRIGNQNSACFGCYFEPWFGYDGFTGTTTFFGGVVAGAGVGFCDGTTLDGDVVIPLRIHYYAGTIIIDRAYFGQTNDVDTPFAQFLLNAASSYGAPRLWGPGGWDAANNSLCIQGGPAVNVLLLTGPLLLDSITPSAGYYWNGSTFVSETITATGIDLRGGYQSMKSPSRFYIAPTVS